MESSAHGAGQSRPTFPLRSPKPSTVRVKLQVLASGLHGACDRPLNPMLHFAAPGSFSIARRPLKKEALSSVVTVSFMWRA